MPIVYATNVQRWVNDHRVAGTPYVLTTETLVDAHVRAGWATREPPAAAAAAVPRAAAAMAPAAPAVAKKAAGNAGRSSLLAEGTLSAVPAEQKSE